MSDQSKKRDLTRAESDQLEAYKPDTDEYVPVNDVREKMERISQDNPATEEEKRAFYRHKARLIKDSDIAPDDKDRLLGNLSEGLSDRETKFALDEPLDKRPPTPGGVGYGVIYNDGAYAFNNATALYFYIVTPGAVGGNSQTWFYLTATNRSVKGVEAFVSYYAQDAPTFKVFDWAKTGDDHWALAIPYQNLGDYRITYEVNSRTYETLYVANWTELVSGTTWRNRVLLYNQSQRTYDLVYAYEYTLASNDEQKYQFWGPIVETFQTYPDDTNEVGFFEASLWQDGVGQSLTAGQTNIRVDDHGFQSVYLVPNSSFLVK
jgi:hypothetical protein